MKIAASLLLLALLSFPAFAQEQSFEDWVAELRAEAAALGISESTLAALDDLEAPLPRVLELDSSQPEFVQTFYQIPGPAGYSPAGRAWSAVIATTRSLAGGSASTLRGAAAIPGSLLGDREQLRQ